VTPNQWKRVCRNRSVDICSSFFGAPTLLWAVLSSASCSGGQPNAVEGTPGAGGTTSSSGGGAGTAKGGSTATNASTAAVSSGGISEITIGSGGTSANSAGGASTVPDPVCGNGVQEQGEACDDGGTDSGDGCSSDCKTVEEGYICPEPGKSCRPAQVCGDSKVQGTENCDDGNDASGDGCSDKCRVETGWGCPIVGARCRAAECGDGLIVDAETCDDGNAVSGDGCSATCRLEYPTTSAPATWLCQEPGQPCVRTTCGDGNRQGTEQCDDGNNQAYDGCSPTCTREPTCGTETSPVGKCASRCGDGILLVADGEECDDGNTTPGDGCSADCKEESGYHCTAVTANPPTTLQIPIIYRDFQAFSKWGDTATKTDPVGHPDFERITPQSQSGIVDDLLGVDRKPVYMGTDTSPPTGGGATTPQTTGKLYFDQWYRDVKDINIHFDDNLTLARRTDGSYSMDSRTDSPWAGLNGFYPLDGRGYGNDGVDDSKKEHNFHFTSELRFWFEYKGNEKLEFSGDDDVWVFVNGHLAVDLGGIHCRQYGVVKLDAKTGHGGACSATANVGSVGNPTACGAEGKTCTPSGDTDFELAPGSIYEAVVFQAERHTTNSNYWLTLSNFLAGQSVCSPQCGDGIRTPDEACDLGKEGNTGAYNTCKPDCTLPPYCGDGNVDSADGEECDDGHNVASYGFNGTPACEPGCKLTDYCGDGKVDSLFGEQCDDGNKTPNDGCENNCTQRPGCGNGVLDPGEECDDGNTKSGDGCTEFCTFPNILL
jgi:fibro-slime domain-containing protein